MPSLDALKGADANAQLVVWVTSEFERMRSGRQQFKQQWDLNYAFYKGRQYYDIRKGIDGVLRLAEPTKVPAHRVRITVNKVRPTVLTEVAKSIQSRPSASVVPASSSDEDAAMAGAAEQVWENISQAAGFDTALVETTFWRSICGTAFLKVWWNSARGPTIQVATETELQDPFASKDPATGAPLDTPADPSVAGQQQLGQALSAVAAQPQGDVDFQCISPYYLLVPDIRLTDIQAQPYVLQVFTMGLDAARAAYPGVDFQASTSSSQDVLDDAVLRVNQGERAPDSVLCMEMWVKPGGCRFMPQGGMIQIVGNQLVYKSDQGIPYRHGDFPFVKFDLRPSGVFYSDSTIVDLIPLQREYNRTKSQMIEAKNRMAKPQLLYQQGSLDPRKITSEPGLAISYKPGFNPPSPLPLTSLPSYVGEELDRLQGDWEDLSGQHQVSRGEAPSGVTAATAISFLQEKDDGILATAFFSMEKGCEAVAHQTLELCVQYWDIARTIKAAGANKSFDVLLLRGADLEGSTDIRMEGGSSLPTSKAARQAFIMDLMKMGFVPPDEGLRLLEMGGVSKLYESLHVDQAQAARENIKLKKADPAQLEQFQQAQAEAAQMAVQAQQQDLNAQVAQDGPQALMDPATGLPQEPPTPAPMESILPVNTYDNHEVHIMVHNDFRKTQEFELLPEPVKNEFEAHVNMHLAAVSQAMAQVNQVTAQGQMGGPGAPAPGGPGGGPVPPGPPGGDTGPVAGPPSGG